MANLRETTLNVALHELQKHVRETGGNNRGPDVEKYQKAAGAHAGDAWCDAFVNWCAEQGAAQLGVESPLEQPGNQAYVQSLYEWAAKHDLLVEARDVLPGDLFVLYFPNLGRYAHVGFVLDMARYFDQYTTIEGNSTQKGTRESTDGGDGVVSNRRPVGPHTRFIRWTSAKVM